jgi:hypothetical protein
MPTPASPQKFDWVNWGCGAVFVGGIVGMIVWGLLGAPHFWEYFSDDSIVVKDSDEIDGVTTEYGRIYSQARVDLPPETELVLPVTRNVRTTFLDPVIEVEVRHGGSPGEVRILTETSIGFRPSKESFRLRDAGRGNAVAKRQIGPILALDVDPGCVHWEAGGRSVWAIFVIPPGQKVRPEPPSGAAFASRYKLNERGNYWPVSRDESKAAGWEEVPLQPLSRKQFR